MIDRFPNLPRSGDSSAETPHADGDSLLDSDLESILRNGSFLAFTSGKKMMQVVERLREEKAGEFDLAGQMAEAICVSLDDYEDPEEGWKPRKRSERLLVIFDVIANLATPEEMKRFLNSDAVARLTDEWGDDKLNALLQRYGSLGDSYHREKNPGDSKKLKLLTRYVLGRTVNEGEERTAQIAEETRQEMEATQENIAHWEAERKRESVFNEQLNGLVAAISSDPNKCFGEIVSKDFEIDVPDADRYSENVKSRCADAYLKATAIEGSDSQLHDRAVLALSEVLHKKLAERSREERSDEVWWQNYPYIRHNLAMIIPDVESYEEIVRQYPGLEENNEIYEDWKKSFIELRLKESALQEVDPSVLGLLREADVSCLDIEAEQMYVKYTSRADLYSDLEKYFIGPIDSENSESSLRPWGCRSNSNILQEDIIEPLDRLTKELRPGEYRTFMPKGAEYPDAPYEYEETSFEGSAITIDVMKQENGAFTYALGIRGDVISRFAAFVGKPVGLLKPATQAYVRIGIATRNNKATAEQLENQYQAIKDERHPDITSELGTKTYRYWDLPYSGTPNHTTAHLLQDLAGLDSQLYMKRFGPHNDELLIEADLSNLPEAQRMLYAVIDTKSGKLKRLDEIVPHADMRVKNIRPDQARKLKALGYLLSITQIDRN
ncbi:hypothetical protein EUA61_00580 [TM7 phylum sp. oral taxon 346]|nr:hypothetical protein EUA61_00580 [TM7 phylum sp. oral taxon 346]